jgi:hypothetical protein
LRFRPCLSAGDRLPQAASPAGIREHRGR